VWNDVTGVFDITSGGTPGTAISITTERLAFDRRTGVLVNCCAAVIGSKKPHFSGQGFVWPIGTQKKTYDIFDTTLLKPVPVQYTGTTTVDGMKTYIFVEHINNEQFGSVSLPGSLVHESQATVTLPEYLTATNTYYVDPGTGSPLKVSETSDQTLQNPATGATALTLYSGTLTSTASTIAAAEHTASTSDTEISWVQNIGPLIAVLLGIVLLVAGIVLIATGDIGEYEYEEDEPIPAEA
jgi:hypothetical protein